MNLTDKMESPNERHAVPTIRDIADRVGVHKATVSAVLNGGRSTARVSEATRRRIVAAAKELRYSPNAMARGLKMVRFKSIGLAFNYSDPSWITHDQYGTSLLTGVIMAASRVGYNVTHFYKAWQDAEHSAAGFRGQGIDGFLVIAPVLGSDIVSGLSALGIPLVVISAPPGDSHIPKVLLDNELGIQMALNHLFELGHRKIGYITGGNDQFDSLVRRQTYIKTMETASAPILPGYLGDLSEFPHDEQYPDTFDETYVSNGAYKCIQRMLSLPEPPTAVMTAGAGIAEPALYGARDMGIRVPQELSIIGFDDTYTASHVAPPLTTIRQPLVDMGQCAARLLISLVEHEPISVRTHIFKPEFVLRGSTATAPAS